MSLALKAQSEDITEEDLRKIGNQFFFLEQVDERAREHMLSCSFVDPVEVQLALRISLKDRFSLPFTTQNMLYMTCASLSQEKIDSYAEKIAVEGSKKEEVDKFLAAWQPWLQFKRRQEIPLFEELGKEEVIEIETCVILHAHPDQPVILGGNTFEYSALRRIYIQTGKNPMNTEPFKWKSVKRVLQKMDPLTRKGSVI